METTPHEPSPPQAYGHNLTQLARQGAFPARAGYEAAVERIFEMLLRRAGTSDLRFHRCNPLILDLDGSTRWKVIPEVIRRMAVGDAPDPLPTRQIIALDYELLLAKSPDDAAFQPPIAPSAALAEEEAGNDELETWDDFERWFAKHFPHGLWSPLEAWEAPNIILQRLQAIFLAVRQSEGRILLCIDHFHRLLGGEEPTYPIQACTLLKPTLARREIQLIGACTLDQYRQWIFRDAAIQCRMQEVLVIPPDRS
jgi:ATP-dependent Clp protease ATP-binding subunit ClpA